MNEIEEFKPYNLSKVVQEELQKSINELQDFLSEKQERLTELSRELDEIKRDNYLGSGRGYSGQAISTLFEVLGEFVKISSKLYANYRVRDEIKKTQHDYNESQNELDKKNIILEIFTEREKLRTKLEADGFSPKEIGEYLTMAMLDSLLLANKDKSYDELSDIFDSFIKFSLMSAVASQDKDLEDFINVLKEKKDEYIKPKKEEQTEQTNKKYTYKSNHQFNKQRLVQKNRQ